MHDCKRLFSCIAVYVWLAVFHRQDEAFFARKIIIIPIIPTIAGALEIPSCLRAYQCDRFTVFPVYLAGLQAVNERVWRFCPITVGDGVFRCFMR